MSYFQRENRELVNVDSCELLQSQFGLIGDFSASCALDFLAEVSEQFLPRGEPSEKYLPLADRRSGASAFGQPRRCLAGGHLLQFLDGAADRTAARSACVSGLRRLAGRSRGIRSELITASFRRVCIATIAGVIRDLRGSWELSPASPALWPKISCIRRLRNCSRPPGAQPTRPTFAVFWHSRLKRISNDADHLSHSRSSRLSMPTFQEIVLS